MKENNSIINYTFIIPHKNGPKLLARCLASIPRRDDVQIIVVDDASDPDIVNWDTYKFTNDTCVELVLTTEKRGAGFARNEGLKRAKGKWLLFCDADDTYVDGFLDILDEYKESDNEVIYFNYYRSDNNGNKHPVRLIPENNTEVTDELKYQLKAPWYKMVSRSFINKYNILFEETLNGNDVFYTYQVGYFTKKCIAIDNCLYIYWYNDSGLTNNKNKSEIYFVSQFKHLQQSNAFYDYIGHPNWKKSITERLCKILVKKGIGSFFYSFKVYLMNRRSISQNKYLFVNYFKNYIKE